MTPPAAALVGSALLALACSPAEDLLLSVETWNVALAGSFSPHEAERREMILEAVAGMESDIACIQEAWLQSDKDAIIEAAADRFPYSVSFEHDLGTAVDDARDQDGIVPTDVGGPPCPEGALGTLLDDAVACLRDACSTVPGSEEGLVTSTTCAQRECLGVATPLLLRDAPGLRCYACVATSLPTETLAAARARCSTDGRAVLSFGGQNGEVLLSRHPLGSPSVTVLPATWNRRVIVSATAEVEGVGPIDVHCTHLTPIFDSPAFPYTGAYGGGAVTASGWEAEQRLQAERLVERVEATTGRGHGLVLGTVNASRGFRDQAQVVVVEQGVGTMRLLDGAFTEAVARGYVPACTVCPANPLTGGVASPVWVDRIFMTGIDPEDVRSTERTFVDPVVPVAEGTVPLSDHFGLRSVIAFRP